MLYQPLTANHPWGGKENGKVIIGGASVPASCHGSCGGHLLPLGGEGRDEGALRQSEVNVVRSGHKNLTGKEKVKFLMLYQPLATIGPLPGKETVAHQPPSSIFGPRRPLVRQKRGDKCAKKRQKVPQGIQTPESDP